MGKQNEKQGTYNRTFLASRAWASRLTWETLRMEKFHVFRRKPTHSTVNQNFFSTCTYTHTQMPSYQYTVWKQDYIAYQVYI